MGGRVGIQSDRLSTIICISFPLNLSLHMVIIVYQLGVCTFHIDASVENIVFLF